MRPFQRQRRGANAVEFALTLPIFLLLLGGIVDFGWMFYYKAALNSAVYDACRAGVTRDPGEGRADISVVYQRANTALEQSLAEVGFDDLPTDPVYSVYTLASSADVPVIVLQCDMTIPWTPLWGLVEGRDLRGRSVIRMEFQRAAP